MIRIICLVNILFWIIAFQTFGQGLKIESPRLEGFHPLDDEPLTNSPLSSENPVILKLQLVSGIFKDTAVIDFEKRQITFRRYDNLGFRIWEYHYKELSDYLLERRNFALVKGWKSGLSVAKEDDRKEKASVMKFEWEMPVHYPSWAQRIIGTDPPRLSINGSLAITMGFDNSTFIESSSDKDHASSTGFDFQVDYMFSISGSVGRLINVNISADNQNEFAVSDVFKNFKIHYKESTPGELEDEIIQEVEAGWTAFQMPGTELSGYSESNEGLFGIKVRSQLGPLSLTSVISHERGESQKKTIPLNGSANMSSISEKEYVQNRFFFLDTKYRSYYNRKYGGSSGSPSIPKVDTLFIFRDANKSKDLIREYKKITMESDPQVYDFVRMHRDRQFYLNETEGWIRFEDSVDVSNNHVAIYMRSNSDPSLNKGSMTFTVNSEGEPDTAWNLWVLKQQIPVDSAGTDITSKFHLMWRNVYDLDSSDWSKFKFNIVQKTPDDETEREAIESNGKTLKISEILGIAVNGEYALDQPQIFDKNNGYLIFPPFDTSFFGNEPFRNELLKDYRDTLIYKYSIDAIQRNKNHNTYYILYTSKSQKQSVFPLGWDIMEGEIIKADGNTLERNVDYTLDYESGDLTLISPAAKNATNITAEYQQASMFNPEKKIFFGNRAELKLPFISENSFAGFSFLYQNVKVNEKIPQLEQEPFNKGLLDFNIRIDLQPEWMTTLVNKIPLINTSAESKMVFDFEYARSFVNPNPEGEAYVDDFEDSKQYVSLPTIASSWYQASPPFYDSILTPDSLHKYPPAWDFYWFTPKDEEEEKYKTKAYDIRDLNQSTVTTSSNEYETVLRLHCIPSVGGEYNSKYSNAWAGIMTPIYDRDKSEEQYLEFIVKAEGGFNGKGKLLIQLGTIREDLSVNGGPPDRIDNVENVSFYDNRDKYDSDKDRGLDSIKIDSLEYFVIPGLTQTWDTLRYNDWRLGVDKNDPGRDNFRKYEGKDGRVENRRYSNRKQGDNSHISEDINSDGLVYTHKTESYYQFTIDLSDDDAPIIDRNANVKYNNGWRKYRIPLKEVIAGFEIRDSVNNPNWKNIEMARLIWTGFDSVSLTKEHQLILTDLQFIGSQWLPQYDSVGTKIEASSIDNKDDNFYRSQVSNEPLVYVDKDNNGDEELESSLRLNFKNVKPGDTAIVDRAYNYHNFDISAYSTLTMALYGRNPDGSTVKGVKLYDGMIDYVFRFGSDDSTYYEYRCEIYSGWQEVKIDLRTIADLKDRFMNFNSDTIPIEDSTTYGKATLRVVSKAANRKPNFTKIQWMGIGVIREKGDINSDNSSGEIWVNELKVSGIDKLTGNAIRANVNTQWADLLNVSGNLVFTDGDFRKMTDQSIQRQNSSLSTSFSTSMNVNKFMPQNWGINIPVGFSYNNSVTRPQLKSNSDVKLTNESGKSDNIVDLLTDRDSPSKHYQQKSTNLSAYFSFDKTQNSDNPLLNLTADRISGNFRYNTSNSCNRQGPSRQAGVDYMITSKSEVYTGDLKYDLSPIDPPTWTRWKPFGSVKSEILQEYELSLLPQTFTFDLINFDQGTYHNEDTKKRTKDKRYELDVKHGVVFQYNPISPLLEMNYSLDITRDLQKYANNGGSEMVNSVFSLFKGNSAFARDYLILEGEKTRSQSAKVNVSPKVFDWLTTSAQYSSDYGGDIVRYFKDSTDYISTRVKSTFSFDASFDFDQVLENLVKATAKSRMAGFFSGVDSFFDAVKLSSINFNYSASQNLINNYLNNRIIGSGFEFIKYQLGIKGKDFHSFWLGDMDDNVLGGMRYRALKGDSLYLYREDRRNTEQKYTISSGLSITVPFQLSISPISLSWSRNFEVRPDTSYYDTSITFPDFSIGLRSSALMKLSMINNILQSLDLSSNLNYKRSMRINSSIIDTTEDFSMSPLIGINGTIKKWPINFSYRAKISRSKTFDTDINSKIRTGGHELDISYHIERNSRLSEIKLLRWRIPVRGKTTMGLTGSRDIKKEEKENGIEGINEVSFSIKPYLSYVFTDNITGSFEYTHGKVKRDEQEEITRKMALIVNIQFK